VRSKGVLFTSSSDQSFDKMTRQIIFDEENNDRLDALIHNRRFWYINKYIENYLLHFNLNSLFINGDNARHHAPGMGVLNLVSLPFIIIGIFFVIRKKTYSSLILFSWLFIAPVASSFAINAPNYQRSLIFLPTFHVFEALGLIYFLSIIKRVKFSRFYVGLISILFVVNIFYYLHQYFFHTNTDFGKYWQYGYREAIDYVDRYMDTDKRVFFANDIEQGYIFYLFYNNYSPIQYSSQNGSNRINANCYAISNAYFGICNNMIKKGDIYVTSNGEESSDLKKIKEIRDSNSEIAISIFEHI
jgi:hypothetical protein